jgi:LPXTG-motif cell wall-anchored protein
MNRIITALIGVAFLASTLLIGTSAFATPERPSACAVSGLSDIPRGDPRYLSGLDGDRDGVMCEGNTSSVAPPAPVGPANPEDSYVAPAPDVAVGGTSTGTPASGTPAETGTTVPAEGGSLANTGANANLAAVAVLLILVGGAVFLLTRKRRTT